MDLNGNQLKGYGGAVLFPRAAAVMVDADRAATPATDVFPVQDVTSSVALTATRNYILPLTDGAIYLASNFTSGGQSVTFKGATGTGVTVTNGKSAWIRTDGVNYIRMSADV